MFDVICYGGPLHGQRRVVQHWKFYVAVTNGDHRLHVDRHAPLWELAAETVEYRIETAFRRVVGRYGRRAERVLRFAVTGDMDEHRAAINEALDREPWRWETSILADFNDWWRHALYKRRLGKELEIIDSYGPWYDR